MSLPAPAIGRWPLVGRGDALELVARALDEAAVQAVLLHGRAGVGKTRLAEELLTVAAERGRTVGRARATAATAGAPLGALAPLLPPTILESRFDPVALFSTMLDALGQRDEGRPHVLFVDDLHLLDSTSAILLVQLLDAGALVLVATVRSGEPVPDAVTDLWRRDTALRIDVVDLTTDDVDALLHLALGGPVDGTTLNQLWTASQGNPLFLRELVLGALDRGALAMERGVWRLTGRLPATDRLIELVEARIGEVTGAPRDALDLLAVWEPVGLADLEALVGRGAVEVLDRAGLITLRLDQRRHLVSLSHPLHGEALRARLSTLTRTQLLLDHADRIGAHGARRREDPLRLATARLEGTGSADPGLLLAAARLARHGQDFHQVARLSRAALAERRSAEAVLVLAEALYEVASSAEAEDVLAAFGDPFAAPDVEEELAVALTAVRVRNLATGLGRPDDALAVSRAAQAHVTDPDRREELATEEAMAMFFTGRPLDAAEALSRPRRNASRGDVVRSLVEIPVLSHTGRPLSAARLAQEARVAQSGLGDQLATGPAGIFLVYEAHALLEAGRVAEAEELAARERRAAGETALSDVRMWLALVLARAALLRGRPRTAQRWASEAAVLAADFGHDGPRRLVLATSAVCLAHLGDADGARQAVEEVDRLPPYPFKEPEQRVGHGWAALAAGRPEDARRILRTAAADAATLGWRTSEVWLLHDLARIGDPGTAAPRLAELATAFEGDLVPTCAAHARALERSDPEGLIAAADRFETLGLLLLGAEAATAASLAFERAGDRQAARLATRATTMAASCEGARTPGLETIDAPTPLTPREREIAVLAAQAVPSREIAERLYLSVRTVNNHLQSTYTKLGVTSRSELAAALDQPRP